MKDKGFTLIELLAVITIMGILMLIAIPAVSRTIENSRKSTFADTALSYLNAVKKAVQQDQLVCNDAENRFSVISSKPAAGCNYINGSCSNTQYWSTKPMYYYYFDSSQSSGQNLLESGGKSPWQSNDIKGVVYITKYEEDGVINYKYLMYITDEAGYGFGYAQKYTADSTEYMIPIYIVEEKYIGQKIVGKRNERKDSFTYMSNSDVYAKTPYSGNSYMDRLFLSKDGINTYSYFYYVNLYSCSLSL